MGFAPKYLSAQERPRNVCVSGWQAVLQRKMDRFAYKEDDYDT
jgi:hypothetical protein